MPDGKRKRRHSQNKAKQTWYAFSRSVRFARRFGSLQVSLCFPANSAVLCRTFGR